MATPAPNIQLDADAMSLSPQRKLGGPKTPSFRLNLFANIAGRPNPDDDVLRVVRHRNPHLRGDPHLRGGRNLLNIFNRAG